MSVQFIFNVYLLGYNFPWGPNFNSFLDSEAQKLHNFLVTANISGVIRTFNPDLPDCIASNDVLQKQ